MADLFTALFKFLSVFFQWLPSRNKAGDVIVRTAQVYDAMRELIGEPDYGIGRVLIMYAHNGGFDLKTGKPAYVTCLHEETRPPFSSVKNEYQKLSIDGPYNTMLMQVYLNKWVDYQTNNMEEGLLKNIYLSEGVQKSRVFFLKHTKEAFWYMSVASHDLAVSFDNPHTQVALNKAVSTIKQRI